MRGINEKDSEYEFYPVQQSKINGDHLSILLNKNTDI